MTVGRLFGQIGVIVFIISIGAFIHRAVGTDRQTAVVAPSPFLFGRSPPAQHLADPVG
jgi:hypothetical protein